MTNNVFITGGSRGIGAAAVLAFARAGYNVAFTYNSHPDAADRVRTDGNIEPSAAEAAALARENAAAKATREREAAEAGTGAATTPTEA